MMILIGKYMKKKIMLLMAITFFIILGCDKKTNNSYQDYIVDHYSDTICGQHIITTVCHNKDNTALSVSTITLGIVDSIDNTSDLNKYLE